MSARNLDKTDYEIADFIAENNPSGVLAFHSSAEAKDRLADLISHEKTTNLSPDEKSELDFCILVEPLMRLAKAKARSYLLHEKRPLDV